MGLLSPSLRGHEPSVAQNEVMNVEPAFRAPPLQRMLSSGRRSVSVCTEGPSYRLKEMGRYDDAVMRMQKIMQSQSPQV